MFNNTLHELKAECYIGFQKLLNEELRAFDLKDAVIFDLKLNPSGSGGTYNNHIQNSKTPIATLKDLSDRPDLNLAKHISSQKKLTTSKKKAFEEKLWFCGKHVGDISGIISFYNLPVLYQMRVGVLTKTGILFTSKPFLSDG